MDGENNGQPDFLMDDLGVPLFLETPVLELCISSSQKSCLDLPGQGWQESFELHHPRCLEIHPHFYDLLGSCKAMG